MKGLLLKDFYTLLKQMYLYLIFIVLLSLIPEMNLFRIASVYAAMLPITVIGFDERSKWDHLAIMMPYSKRDLVMSKYVIGYLGIAVCSVISLIIQAVVVTIANQPFTVELALTIVLTSFAALAILAINLPFMFWLGVERGRIVFMVLIAVTVFLGMMSAANASKAFELEGVTPAILLLAGALAALLLNVLSATISLRLYSRKMS